MNIKTMLTLALLVNISSSISAMDADENGNAYGPDWQPKQLTAEQLKACYKQNAVTLKNQRKQAKQDAQLALEMALLMNPQPGYARNLLQDLQRNGEQQ